MTIGNYNFAQPVNSQGLSFGNNGLGLAGPVPGSTGLGLQTPLWDSGNALSRQNGGGSGFELGLNAPTFQMGLGALNSVGNIWGAWQANRLARDQLDFTKNFANTNLNNSIQSYNTALGDRARARGFTEGRSDTEVADYVSANRLSR